MVALQRYESYVLKVIYQLLENQYFDTRSIEKCFINLYVNLIPGNFT